MSTLTRLLLHRYFLEVVTRAARGGGGAGGWEVLRREGVSRLSDARTHTHGRAGGDGGGGRGPPPARESAFSSPPLPAAASSENPT